MTTTERGGRTFAEQRSVEAARDHRTERLWERDAYSYSDVAPSQEDRDADMVEHILGAELVRELEVKLGGPLPDQTVPPSPHLVGDR